jgi:hypothetical protein
VKRHIFNALLGLVGAGLVLTSLVLLSRGNRATSAQTGTVNLRAAGESYRSRVRSTENLLKSDSPFAEINLSDNR